MPEHNPNPKPERVLDYNRFITRGDIDMAMHEEKFRLCEECLRSDNSDHLLYSKLLNDPATFAYLMFRLDGSPVKMYPYQDMIINDTHRFKIFRAANQIGKSVLFDIKAARNLIIDHGHAHNEAIVSKSLPQSMFQMRRVKSLLNSMQGVSWRDEKISADSMSVIMVDIRDDSDTTFAQEGRGQRIKYSNLLVCAPCTEGLLGYDLHELNLDEFEYWTIDIKYFFNQIAQPRTYHTKGNIWIFSNPNGQDNFVAELETYRLKNGNRKWHTYIFNYLDKPGNTQDEYDELKRSLSRQEFESTVAAIRSIGSNNYFTPDEIEKSCDSTLTELKMIGKTSFWFLDVGSKHDQSVLVGGFVEPDEANHDFVHIYVPVIHCYPVGYPLTRVAGANVDDSDGWHYEKSVKEHLAEWSVGGVYPEFGVDVTGNSGIVPLFNAVNVFPVDITFSGPAKSGYYQRFKYFMEKGLLHRIPSKEFAYQCARLEMRKSVRGYLMIHHESEDDLDDVPDAFAGLIALADPKSIGDAAPSLRFF